MDLTGTRRYRPYPPGERGLDAAPMPGYNNRSPARRLSSMFKIAIIGSGPSGLSAAAHAHELGFSRVLLQSKHHPAATIYKYQKGKYVMAEPNVLPLRSPMSFAAGTREQILGAWNQELAKYGVNIRHGAGVTAISGERGSVS